MPDCVTCNLRSYKSDDLVKAPFLAFISGNGVVVLIPRVCLFFNRKHCKILLIFSGRFEEEFSTANKICFSAPCMECYFRLQRECVTRSGTNGQTV